MSTNEHFRDEPVDPSLEPEYAEQLLDEAGRTISGLPLIEDPRETSALAEEQKRLQAIADSLIPPTAS